MNADGFLEIVKRYSDITELSLEILNEFIDKIVVHHREEINYIKQQRVEIYYKMIGFIEVPIMSKNETDMLAEYFGRTRKEQIA